MKKETLWIKATFETYDDKDGVLDSMIRSRQLNANPVIKVIFLGSQEVSGPMLEAFDEKTFNRGEISVESNG